MKKFIFLIVLSLFFKAYVCDEADCKKGENGVCAGGEEAGKTKCVSDGEGCKLKTFCESVSEPNEDNCKGALTTNEKKECVFQAKGTEEGSKDQCKEVEKKDTSDTTKSSTKSDEKADDTTKRSTKADEKNGANYAKLSFGLLGLLFF